MTSIQKLAAYRAALETWARKKYSYDLADKNGKPIKKPLEPEPKMTQFEIPENDAWASKVRAEVMNHLNGRLAAINNVIYPKIKVPQKRGIKIPTMPT